MKERIKLYNGCAGLSANVHLLSNDKFEITSTERFEKIANANKLMHPGHKVLIEDSFQHFQDNHEKYNAAWFSPNCQSHSRMVKATRHKVNRIPDMTGIYGLITFLDNFYKGDWVVENVVPFYKPLIEPTLRVGRHLFWSNKPLFGIEDVKRPKGFINNTNTAGANALKDWLGMEYEGNLYYNGNHCPAQPWRNCVHPKIGLQIIEQLIKN